MNAGGPWWLGSHACAAVLTFALDGETPILAAGRRHAGNAMAMTHQQFEPRVAVPRLLALLADYDVSATFFVPGLTAERWPAMVSAVAEAGHEVAHHSYSHRPATGYHVEGPEKAVAMWCAELDAMRRYHCLFVPGPVPGLVARTRKDLR